MRVVLLASLLKSGESIGALLDARGHDVLRFSEPKRALNELETDRTANAFIVLDSGHTERAIETCWEARLIASFERPIYIGLVARPMPSRSVVEALDCGADDVLQMPLSSDELYARLRSAERFNQMQMKLVRMATRDALTGLLNRSAFFNQAGTICRDSAGPLAAIMVDIDHFKTVNDKFGHAAGDKALKSIAECLPADGNRRPPRRRGIRPSAARNQCGARPQHGGRHAERHRRAGNRHRRDDSPRDVQLRGRRRRARREDRRRPAPSRRRALCRQARWPQPRLRPRSGDAGADFSPASVIRHAGDRAEGALRLAVG